MLMLAGRKKKIDLIWPTIDVKLSWGLVCLCMFKVLIKIGLESISSTYAFKSSNRCLENCVLSKIHI